MEEHNWELPANFAELAAQCAGIRAAGLEPGCIGMQLTGVPFATVFNLAKTGWFNPDPEDHYDGGVLNSYLGERKAVFCTARQTLASSGRFGKALQRACKRRCGHDYFVWLDQRLQCPDYDGRSGKGACQSRLDPAGDGDAYPYVLMTRVGKELDDNTIYKVAFLLNSFDAQVGETCNVQQGETPLSTIIHVWLEESNALLAQSKDAAEQALQIAEAANKAKSAFLSSVGHDIRTPMNAIVGAEPGGDGSG